MSDQPIPVLAAFENVLDDTGENLHYYSPEGGVDDPAEAQRRLIKLLADAVQAIASDITNAVDENPDLAVHVIVAKLRHRAIELSPESVRRYDPRSGWAKDDPENFAPWPLRAQSDLNVGHLVTARQVAEALRQLGEQADVDDMSDDYAASVVVNGYDQCSFYVTDDGWSTVLHTPVPEDVHHCTDVDGAVNGLPATADPNDVAAKIIAHLKGDGGEGSGPDPQA